MVLRLRLAKAGFVLSLYSTYEYLSGVGEAS